MSVYRFDFEKMLNLRRAAGIKQTQMAEMCYVSQAVICKIENGATAPGVALMKRICTVLGVSMDDLMVKV